MHIPTFVFIFILFLKNILLLLLYPKHVIKLLGYNLGCYKSCKAPIYLFWEGSGWNLNQESFPIFDHTHYPDLRTDFWVINKGNLAVSPPDKLYPHQ